MSTQKINSIKIPPFSKEHFGLWKRHMLLFLRTANRKYIGILNKGVTTPTNVILSHEVDGVVIPHKTVPKEPSEYTDEENELMNLDDALQLILVESLDPVMYNAVVNCTNAKQIWDTLEIINEGSEEVRENKKEILMAQYE